MAKKEKVIYPSIIEIESFLEKWKVEVKKFYLNLFDQYLEEKSKKYEITKENLESVVDWYGKREFSDEEIEKILLEFNTKMYFYKIQKLESNIHYSNFRIWKEKLTQEQLRLCERYSHEQYRQSLEDYLIKEVDKKRENLFKSIDKKVGMIKQVQFIKIGSDGELNGTFVGETGKVNVNTIYAGGYNVQCLHFRFLIKVIK